MGVPAKFLDFILDEKIWHLNLFFKYVHLFVSLILFLCDVISKELEKHILLKIILCLGKNNAHPTWTKLISAI